MLLRDWPIGNVIVAASTASRQRLHAANASLTPGVASETLGIRCHELLGSHLQFAGLSVLTLVASESRKVPAVVYDEAERSFVHYRLEN